MSSLKLLGFETLYSNWRHLHPFSFLSCFTNNQEVEEHLESSLESQSLRLKGVTQETPPLLHLHSSDAQTEILEQGMRKKLGTRIKCWNDEEGGKKRHGKEKNRANYTKVTNGSHNHIGFHALAHTTGVSFHVKNIPAADSDGFIDHPSLYLLRSARTSSQTSSLYETRLNPLACSLLDHRAAVSRRSMDSVGEHAIKSITARPAARSSISRSLLVFEKLSSRASK
ncbi:hypothetical protein LXL04_024402 [Taraxacum kok-saghyz]